MAKKNSEKSYKMLDSEWRRALKRGKCFVGGCSLKSRTCQHLDAYVNGATQVSVRAINYTFYERLPEEVKEPSPSTEKFRNALLDYELTPVQRQLLMLKFVDNLSFRDIAREMQEPSLANLYRTYKSTLESLKEQGFSLGDLSEKE